MMLGGGIPTSTADWDLARRFAWAALPVKSWHYFLRHRLPFTRRTTRRPSSTRWSRIASTMAAHPMTILLRVRGCMMPTALPRTGVETPQHWQAYWGGDLLGIQDKLSYIKGLNATAIWISPTNDNENLNTNSGAPISAPYHGYWNRDFMRVEEHFGDTSNVWTEFTNLASAAHSDGIKLIVDWAQNHSNPNNGGENGALYNNGTLMATPSNDPNGYFHHNGNISNYDDRYQVQYDNLDYLQDLNQENSTIDSYLKTAAQQFQNNGA